MTPEVFPRDLHRHVEDIENELDETEIKSNFSNKLPEKLSPFYLPPNSASRSSLHVITLSQKNQTFDIRQRKSTPAVDKASKTQL